MFAKRWFSDDVIVTCVRWYLRFRLSYRDLASIVADPAGARLNTLDNTPAVIHVRMVPGDNVEVKIAAKGGGSENKATFVTLRPADSAHMEAPLPR